MSICKPLAVLLLIVAGVAATAQAQVSNVPKVCPRAYGLLYGEWCPSLVEIEDKLAIFRGELPMHWDGETLSISDSSALYNAVHCWPAEFVRLTQLHGTWSYRLSTDESTVDWWLLQVWWGQSTQDSRSGLIWAWTKEGSGCE